MGYVQRKLVKLVIRVVSFPKFTLAICGVILAGSVVLALLRLNLSTDEDELMTPKLAFFRDYKEFTREFPENEAFVILLEPRDYKHPPTAQRWIDLADELTAGLSALKDHITRVDSHVPPEAMGAQGMMFDEWESVRSSAEEANGITQLGRVVGDPGSLEAIGTGGLLGQSAAHRLINAVGQDKPENSGPLAEEAMRSLAAALASKRPVAEWTYGIELPRMSMADPRAKTDPRVRGYNMIPNEGKRGTPAYKTEPLLVIDIHTEKDFSSMKEVTEPLNRMRAVVAKIAPKYPEFQYPVITGRPALEADQMGTSERQTRLAEICGLSLVFLVLFLFLRNLWMVIVAELCLGTGIGWTFGWATLMVGRLNLLSLVFVIALIGIGMDYLIQIMMRYRFEKKRYGRPQAIWARVFRYVSPPTSTACCGAAAAFLVAMFTNFHGAAELGLIAGGGLLLCLTAGYTMLPAMLTLFPAKVGKVEASRRYRHRGRHPSAGGMRLLPALIWILASGAGLFLALPPHFDPNLINLQDNELDSVKQVHKLQTWSAVVTSTDLNKLRAARDAILAGDHHASTIDYTESLLDAQDKRDALLKLNAGKTTVAWHDPAPPSAGELESIAQAGEKLAEKWAQPAADGKQIDTSGILVAAKKLAAAVRDPAVPAADKVARAGAWQLKLEQIIRENVEQFAPEPVVISALPPSLGEHLVGRGPPLFLGTGQDQHGPFAKIGRLNEPDPETVRIGDTLKWDGSVVKAIVPADPAPGTLTLRQRDGNTLQIPLGMDIHDKPANPIYALYIYPKADLWNARALEPFVKEVEDKISAHKAATGSDVILTGIAPQLLHSTEEIQGAFIQSTIYALIAIFVLMYLDLRSITQTLMAISVLALGLPMLLFLMYVWRVQLGDPFGVPGSWNLANFFALPILIGAGHEYGVFMVHRYREALHDPRRVWATWDVADRALLLCGIVTTCSFGFLTMTGKHHGLQSLGWVMAVGTASIYLTSLLVLRPILMWRLKQKKVYHQNEEV